MTPARRAGLTRMTILAAHVAALLSGVAFAWAQWADIATQEAAIEQSRQALAQLDARLSPGGLPPAAVTQALLDPFLPGASTALAGANLQDQVVSAIRKAGGTVTSSQVDASDPVVPATGNTPPGVQLTISCEMGNAALQGLLYALESGVPALFIAQLTIEGTAPASGNQPSGSGTLKVTMVISAYRAGVGKS